MKHDWDKEDWDAVGTVRIWNTKDQLKIAVTPDGGFKLQAVNIFVANEVAEFDAILKKTGKPKPQFDFPDITEYETPADQHLEEIDLEPSGNLLGC